MCSFTMTSMQITWNAFRECLKDKASQSSQCLLRQNNRLLKCQPVSLRREWKVVVLVGQHWGVGGGVGCVFFFLSFNVTWAWQNFTRVTCQKISMEGTFCHIHIYQPTDCPRGTSRSQPRCSKGKLASTASAWTEEWFKQFFTKIQ